MEPEERAAAGDDGQAGGPRPPWYARHAVLAPAAAVVMLAGVGVNHHLVHRPDMPPAGKHRDLIERIDGREIPALQSRLGALTRAGSGNVCSLDRPQGLPPDPPAPTADDPLHERIERGLAVVVVAPTEPRVPPTYGIGAVVTANTVVVARSLVGDEPGRYIEARSWLGGRLVGARIVTEVSALPREAGLAVLRLAAPLAEAKPLPVTVRDPPGLPVVLAGSEDTTRIMRRILAADTGKAGDLRFVQGAIEGTRAGSLGIPMLIHNAVLGAGMAAGPLVDLCGRIVGFALSPGPDAAGSARQEAVLARMVQEALRDARVPVRLETDACRPTGRRQP